MTQDEMTALLFRVNCVYPSTTRLGENEHVVRVNEWMTSAVGQMDYADALDAWDSWKDREPWPPSPAQLAAEAKGQRRRQTYRELAEQEEQDALAEGPVLAGDEVRSRASDLRRSIARSDR